MRYLVQLEFYVEAENDADAMIKVSEMATKRDVEKGDQSVVRELHEMPFGSLLSRQVYPNPK